MRWRAELSNDAQGQFERFPRNVRDRISHAIDELEAKDDSQWSNIKALQGKEWKAEGMEGAIAEARRPVPDHFP
ncbi:MAG TPA: hypothetical protein VN924_07150 [Bryobacteraceae bacterium]|nr:hypothetical protein [Bryobacteraceae bacterium]